MGSQKVGRLLAEHRVELDSSEIPRVGPEDVVIKVSSCGICGTDLAFYREGSLPSGTILGHEFSGTITAAGERVSGLRIGDRVTANPMNSGLLGLGRAPGAFAEYLRIASPKLGQNIFKLPEGMSNETGALVEPFAVGLHAVNRARAQPGDRVVIFGAGTIGLCVLAALRARGVENILVVEPNAKRLTLAASFGAAEILNPRESSARAAAGKRFGEENVAYCEEPLARADIVFDCAGVRQIFQDAVRALAVRGRLVLVADPHSVVLTELRLVMLRELEVIGALGYEAEFEEAIGLLAGGTVELSSLITHRFSLTDIAEAFRVQLDAERSVKVMVYPG